MELYHRAGVDEYVTLLLREREVRCIVGATRATWLCGPSDGILRSRVFPGLWLDPKALLEGDFDRLEEVQKQGLQSPEHAAFVKELAGAGLRRRVD